MNIVKKALIATTLAATALVTSTPAMARDGQRGGGRGDTAAIAIGVGILGLAIAAIAASNKRDRYHDRYHVGGGWYYNDNYYYNRSGLRYSRYDWQRRYGYKHNRRGYRDGYYHGGRKNRNGYSHSRRGSRNGWNRSDRRRGGDNRYYKRRGY